MPSTIKELMVAELAAELREMSHAILVDFTGLTAPQADELRATLGEHGASLVVVKNSLAVRALRELGLLDVAEMINGPTAFVRGGDDAVTLSKMLVEWGRGRAPLGVRGGVMDGRAVDATAVAELAALPPLQVLRARVVGAIASPLSGFAGALQGILRSFVGVVKAIAEKEDQA
jgi:large subunit ribosomal protein L10